MQFQIVNGVFFFNAPFQFIKFYYFDFYSAVDDSENMQA